MSLIVPCQLFVAFNTSFFFPVHVYVSTYVLFIVNILAHDQEGGYILWNVHVEKQVVDYGFCSF